MTVAFALDYIEKRMMALGFGPNYLLRFRHLVLQPLEERKVDSYNEYYLLVEENPDLNITSDFGLYDTGVNISSEVQYEHFGKVRVRNKKETVTHAKFIQVIPLQKVSRRKDQKEKDDSDTLKLDMD